MKGQRKVDRVDEKQINIQYINSTITLEIQKKIIETTYLLRFVRSDQIAKVTGYDLIYIRKILNFLYKHRFIDRIFPYEEVLYEKKRQGSAKGVYMLDEAGKILVSGMYDIPLSEVKWRPEENLIKYEKRKHTLECSEIIARIHEECRNAGYKVIEFSGEKHLWMQYSYQDSTYEFEPDVYFKIQTDKHKCSFFVENDEATMSIPSFLAKIPKYENYRLSGQYVSRYEVFPRVLVLTPTKQRALSLATEVSKRQKTKVDFLFTWHDAFYEKPFSENTFLHSSMKGTMSMLDDIPEEWRV